MPSAPNAHGASNLFAKSGVRSAGRQTRCPSTDGMNGVLTRLASTRRTVLAEGKEEDGQGSSAIDTEKHWERDKRETRPSETETDAVISMTGAGKNVDLNRGKEDLRQGRYSPGSGTNFDRDAAPMSQGDVTSLDAIHATLAAKNKAALDARMKNDDREPRIESTYFGTQNGEDGTATKRLDAQSNDFSIPSPVINKRSLLGVERRKKVESDSSPKLDTEGHSTYGSAIEGLGRQSRRNPKRQKRVNSEEEESIVYGINAESQSPSGPSLNQRGSRLRAKSKPHSNTATPTYSSTNEKIYPGPGPKKYNGSLNPRSRRSPILVKGLKQVPNAIHNVNFKNIPSDPLQLAVWVAMNISKYAGETSVSTNLEAAQKTQSAPEKPDQLSGQDTETNGIVDKALTRVSRGKKTQNLQRSELGESIGSLSRVKEKTTRHSGSLIGLEDHETSAYKGVGTFRNVDFSAISDLFSSSQGNRQTENNTAGKLLLGALFAGLNSKYRGLAADLKSALDQSEDDTPYLTALQAMRLDSEVMGLVNNLLEKAGTGTTPDANTSWPSSAALTPQASTMTDTSGVTTQTGMPITNLERAEQDIGGQAAVIF